MKKVVTLLAIFVLSIPALSDSQLIVGSWVCHMSSEYAEQDFTFTLDSDGSYNKESNMFGSKRIELGVWKVEKMTLVLERQKYIKDGKEKDSSQRFEQSISSITEAELSFTNGNSTSKCNK